MIMSGNKMKKRWISLYVENQVGVLSKISGLFSGKSYNLDSLTAVSYTHLYSPDNAIIKLIVMSVKTS